MRAFAWFFGLILAGLAAMGLLAWPAWQLLHPHFDFPFHRIASRIGMLALLVGLVILSRRLGVADRASLGYGAPRRVFVREMFVALGIGWVLMAAVVAVMILLDLRELKPGVVLDAPTLATLALKGVISGLIVAFIEETFLRGAMFTAIQRESGARAAIVLTALVYSATHFIARVRIPADQVTSSSGLDLLAGTLRLFGDPLQIADAFLCLFAVGVVLGMVRAINGNIAACIGLHAGWVAVITLVRETSQPDRSHSLSVLLSNFDGMVGWFVLVWTIGIGVLLYFFYSRRKSGSLFARSNH
jgi:membrane protease YdiL (CAAX protease family)